MKQKTKKPTGYILHKGIINGAPYIAIATVATENRKTGNMVQVWFLLEDVDPVAGVLSGIDALTICQGCPFASGQGCYVNVGQAPLAIYRAYKRGSYPELVPAEYDEVFTGRKVRFGAYGNPSLLPLAKVKLIAKISSGWTGYMHDWRKNPLASQYAHYFMASTETEDSRRMAIDAGFRYFHVSPSKPDSAIECLSDSKGISCAECRLCAGLSKPAKSIWINPHGSGVKKAIQQATK